MKGWGIVEEVGGFVSNFKKGDQMIAAYDTFEHAAKEKALKVILEN